jgi:SHS2 domain-containing protein
MWRALSERKRIKSVSKDIQIVEHTADVGLHVRARDLKTLFQRAAEGMASIIIDPETVLCKQEKTIFVEENTLEEMFLRWLKEILYEMEKSGMVFSQFTVNRDNFSHRNPKKYSMLGNLRGEEIDLARHEICMEIKAVTRHGFSLGKKGSYWESKILFDV